MDFTTLAKAITKLGAPLLGTVLGGPAGGAIGNLIASKFDEEGITNDESIGKLASKIMGDPEASIKLAEIESSHKIELQRLLLQGEQQKLQAEIAQTTLDIDNTKNAREMNVKKESYFPEALSVLIALGFILTIYWIVAYTQDASDKDVLYTLVGVIGTAFTQMVSYWLGSSSPKVNRNNR